MPVPWLEGGVAAARVGKEEAEFVCAGMQPAVLLQFLELLRPVLPVDPLGSDEIDRLV